MPSPVTAENVLRRTVEGIDGEADDRLSSLTVGESLVMVTSESGDGKRAAGIAPYPGGVVPDVIGESALEVARGGVETDELGARAVGIAALNTISAPVGSTVSADPFHLLESGVDRVCMIGLFGPVFSQIDSLHVDLLERNPDEMAVPTDLPSDVEIALHPPEAASSVIPEASVLYVTGSTLVYGGLDRYRKYTSVDQSVVVVGASTSFDPTALFDAGVPIVAGVSVVDVASVREGIAAGHCESKLHETGLQKVMAVDPDVDELPGLRLPEDGSAG
jgi:hypothetical protein